MPVDERTFTAAASASIGSVVAGGAVTFRVEDGADGRSLVEEERSVGLGLEASADRRVSVRLGDEQVTVGTGGNVDGGAEIVETATWIVPTDEVEGLVAARALGAGPGEPSDLGRMVSLVPGSSGVAAVLGLGEEYEMSTARVPEPEWHGIALGVTVEGGAAAGGVASAVSASAAAAGVVGVSVRPRDGAVAVDLAAAGSIGAQLDGSAVGGPGGAAAGAERGPGGRAGAGSLRLVFDRHGRPLALDGRFDVPVSVGARDGHRERRMHVDLSAPGVESASSALDRAGRALVGAIATADVDRIAAAAHSVDDALDAVVVALGSAAVTSQSTYVQAGGAGVGVSTPLGGAELSVERSHRVSGR